MKGVSIVRKTGKVAFAVAFVALSSPDHCFSVHLPTWNVSKVPSLLLKAPATLLIFFNLSVHV